MGVDDPQNFHQWAPFLRLTLALPNLFLAHQQVLVDYQWYLDYLATQGQRPDRRLVPERYQNLFRVRPRDLEGYRCDWDCPSSEDRRQVRPPVRGRFRNPFLFRLLVLEDYRFGRDYHAMPDLGQDLLLVRED